MSIPIEQTTVQINIVLSATQAYTIAQHIIFALELAQKRQEEKPEIHWSGYALEKYNKKDLVAFYQITGAIRVTDSVKIHIAPDKRHKGCSGYCHY